MTAPLRIGVAGLGTVGGGVIRIIDESGDLIAQRSGKRLEVRAVSARNRNKKRGFDVNRFAWHDSPESLAASSEIDVFVELIGGADGSALNSVTMALESGKHVVTANKALIALHGRKLAEIAERASVGLYFEAAVAGGVPVIRTLRDGLVANRISRLYGILNGTCNYILTEMEATGRDFSAVLSEAQAKGFAEADPTFDIGGTDTAHKLAILTALAFGCEPDFDRIYVEGITEISPQDIAMAREFGFRIKLLGVAQFDGSQIEQRVHPCMVAASRPIAGVDGVTNAVVIESDRLGRLVMEGPGAGEEPTASAVISDLVDLARDAVHPAFAISVNSLSALHALPMEVHESAYYLRILAQDKSGVMAAIAEDLAEEGVSIESVIQRGGDKQDGVLIVLVTHECRESVMRNAVNRIAAHQAVLERPKLIRIEPV